MRVKDKIIERYDVMLNIDNRWKNRYMIAIKEISEITNEKMS